MNNNLLRPNIKSIGFCVLGLAFIFVALFVFMGKYTLSVIVGVGFGSLLSFTEYAIRYKLIEYAEKTSKKNRIIFFAVFLLVRIIAFALLVFFIISFDILHNFAAIFSLFFAQLSIFVIRIKA